MMMTTKTTIHADKSGYKRHGSPLLSVEIGRHESPLLSVEIGRHGSPRRDGDATTQCLVRLKVMLRQVK
jgi:hypothetical protein